MKDLGLYAHSVMILEKKDLVVEFLYELVWSLFNGRFGDKYLVKLLFILQKVNWIRIHDL